MMTMLLLFQLSITTSAIFKTTSISFPDLFFVLFNFHETKLIEILRRLANMSYKYIETMRKLLSTLAVYP